jgi:hypothetical protein
MGARLAGDTDKHGYTGILPIIIPPPLLLLVGLGNKKCGTQASKEVCVTCVDSTVTANGSGITGFSSSSPHSFLLGLSTRGSSDGSSDGSGSGSGTTGYRGKKRRRKRGGTYLHLVLQCDGGTEGWDGRLRLLSAAE